MQITYKQIMTLKPCYDPVEIGMTEEYSASVTEFINDYRDKVRRKEDILWVLCCNEFMSDQDLRLFAVWCARQVQHLMTDERSINALDVAERYANGLATKEELAAARDAARAAAWATAWDAARDAAGSAARAAAWATAWDAARDSQIDKLLDYFKTVELGNVYNWSK